MSKKTSESTNRALERVRKGQNPYSAALDEGISPSTIYRALARIRKQTATTGE